MSTNQLTSQRQGFASLEAAILEWKGHVGCPANTEYAMDIVDMLATNAGTTFDHAYLTPSRNEVYVVFANSSQVAAIIRGGSIVHYDPTIPGAFQGSPGRKFANLLPHHDGLYVRKHELTNRALQMKECECSPGLRQPVGAIECSECGEAF